MSAHESAWGQDVLVSVEEVAAVLRCGPEKARELIRSGELPVTYSLGRGLRVTRRAVLEFVDRKSIEEAAPK